MNSDLGNLKSEILKKSWIWNLTDFLVESSLLCQESCHFKLVNYLILVPFSELVRQWIWLNLHVSKVNLSLKESKENLVWNILKIWMNLLLLKVYGSCPQLEICIKEFFVCLLVNVLNVPKVNLALSEGVFIWLIASGIFCLETCFCFCLWSCKGTLHLSPIICTCLSGTV